MTDRPEVSVVIPTRNRERRISSAVDNALRQRDVALEVVVVDDASTDGTWQLLEAIADPRVVTVRRAVRGRLAAARNTGIEAASGEWVAFLDDDDVWSPDKLRSQLDAARTPDVGFVYSGAITVDEDLRPLHSWRLPDPGLLLADLLALNVMPAGASNVLARTELLRDLGGFDCALSHTADWDLWIRLAAATQAACVAEVQVAYRIHPFGQESNRGDEMMEELETIERKHAELRAALGVELDRASFADYARKRGGANVRPRPEGARVTRVARALRARAGRATRRVLPGGEAQVPRPAWLPSQPNDRAPT